MARAEKRAIRAAQAAVAEIDAEMEDVQRRIRGCQEELAALRYKRDHWSKVAGLDEGHKTSDTTEQISMSSAGPKPVEEVSAYLREHSPAYQADITAATGLNSGTVTHALRVLGARHLIAATGRKRRNSPEFEWTGEREPAPAAS